MKHPRAFLFSGVLALLLLATLTLSLSAADTSPAATDQAQLRINEFMADNRFTLEDPDEPGEYPDWIELYNPGPNAVSLNDLYLSDDPERPNRFAITDGLTIPAGGFLIFYADNDSRQGPYHLNFGLSRLGGYLGLFSGATDSVIDSRTYEAQTTDISEGRQVDGGTPWRTFDTPTPRATNALLPPKFLTVLQEPSIPAPDLPVTISAQLTDARGIISATLLYSAGNGSLVAVPMTATGSVTDTAYYAQIPPQPEGTLVRYYLQAKNLDALQGRAPLGAPKLPYRYVVGFAAPELYINEIMPDNEDALVNPDKQPAEYPDWIEIYNPNPTPILLSGLFLTDNRDNPTKYRIPPGVSIPAEGYVIFYADNQTNLGPLHTNFALRKEGEYLGLYAANGQILIDEYEFPLVNNDGAVERYPDGGDEWVVTACISPGAANQVCEVQAHLPLINTQ
jgi:large repetitive protein